MFRKIILKNSKFRKVKDIEDNLCGSFDLKHALDGTDEHKNATGSEQKDMAKKAMGQAEAHQFFDDLQFRQSCSMEKRVAK